jgi:hypothetical protein
MLLSNSETEAELDASKAVDIRGRECRAMCWSNPVEIKETLRVQKLGCKKMERRVQKWRKRRHYQ